MNFGIGVFIGDVSFTSRPYSTNIGKSSNQKIVDSGLFENVHIIPSADDTGISIGCAYYGYWKNFRE